MDFETGQNPKKPSEKAMVIHTSPLDINDRRYFVYPKKA
jgi:hypothetical protein